MINLSRKMTEHFYLRNLIGHQIQMHHLHDGRTDALRPTCPSVGRGATCASVMAGGADNLAVDRSGCCPSVAGSRVRSPPPLDTLHTALGRALWPDVAFAGVSSLVRRCRQRTPISSARYFWDRGIERRKCDSAIFVRFRFLMDTQPLALIQYIDVSIIKSTTTNLSINRVHLASC